MIIRYLFLELKNTYRLLSRSILLFLLSAALLFGALTMISRLFLKQEPISLVTVAVVIPENEMLTKAASTYIEKMESVASVSTFVYTDETSAFTMLETGTAQAAMILPENFYEAVDQGINPPVIVWLSDDNSLSLKLFRQLILSGEAMLRISESGVYAMLETAAYAPSDDSPAQIGNEMALLFMNAALNRSDLFDQKVVSPLGKISFSEYYSRSALLILLLTAGLSLGILYEKRVPALEDRLTLYGIGSAARGLIRMICITLYLFSLILLGLLLFYGIRKTGLLTGNTLVEDTVFSVGILPQSLLLCVSIAGVFHLIYSICQNGLSGGVLVLCTGILQLLCCGLLIPIAYLPGIAAKIGSFLPASVWLRFLIHTDRFAWIWVFLIGLLSAVLGTLFDLVFRRKIR